MPKMQMVIKQAGIIKDVLKAGRKQAIRNVWRPKMAICPNPKCGIENDDNWPLEIDGEILEGGCQDCWEAACSVDWWDAVEALAN